MNAKIKKPVFKKLIRFDADKAAKGVAHHIVDENDNDWGTWTSSLVDKHNKYLKVAYETYEREHGEDPQFKGVNSDVYAFVQVCLKGWSGVLDEDGNEIPFSKEMAFEILTDPDNAWLREELTERRAANVRYYRAVTPVATKEEDAGN